MSTNYVMVNLHGCFLVFVKCINDVAPNARMLIVSNGLGRMGNEAFLAYFKILSHYFLEGMRQTTKTSDRIFV